MSLIMVNFYRTVLSYIDETHLEKMVICEVYVSLLENSLLENIYVFVIGVHL